MTRRGGSPSARSCSTARRRTSSTRCGGSAILQLDPISTVAPPQHLVLFSRLGRALRPGRARPAALGRAEADRVARVPLARPRTCPSCGRGCGGGSRARAGVHQGERRVPALRPARARSARPAPVARDRDALEHGPRSARLVGHAEGGADARGARGARRGRRRGPPREAARVGPRRAVVPGVGDAHVAGGREASAEERR